MKNQGRNEEVETGAEETEDLGISVWQGGKLQHKISRRMKTRFCESCLIW